jgi:hypothetical protein
MSPRRTFALSLSAIAALGALWAAAPGCHHEEPCPDDPGASLDMAPARVLCELPFDVRPIDTVSTGMVTINESPAGSGVWTAEVDGTAGGSRDYGKNPFIYLDLIGNKKVEIDDVAARKSSGWDIAFKRWQIKINSGDSGPGGVLLSRVDNKSLADVKTAPTVGFQEDVYFNDKCEVQLDPIGGLATIVSDWYTYEMGTNRLLPKTEVWVLKRRDGKGHIKVQLTAYYKGMFGGNYTLSWGYLP